MLCSKRKKSKHNIFFSHSPYAPIKMLCMLLKFIYSNIELVTVSNNGTTLVKELFFFSQETYNLLGNIGK